MLFPAILPSAKDCTKGKLTSKPDTWEKIQKLRPCLTCTDVFPLLTQSSYFAKQVRFHPIISMLVICMCMIYSTKISLFSPKNLSPLVTRSFAPPPRRRCCLLGHLSFKRPSPRSREPWPAGGRLVAGWWPVGGRLVVGLHVALATSTRQLRSPVLPGSLPPP